MDNAPDLTSFGRYSRDALRALFAARKVLGRLGGRAVQPEHLLLALLEPGAPGGELLTRLGVACDEIGSALEQSLGRAEGRAAHEDLPLSPALKSVLDRAVSTAADQVGARELIGALLGQGECEAAQLLRSHGLTLDKLGLATS